MSIVASAIFRSDGTVLCARVYVPKPRAGAVSLIDTAGRRARASEQASGSIWLEEHVALFQVVSQQLYVVICEEAANVMEAGFLLELLASSGDAITDPFEALGVLDELSNNGEANHFLLSLKNVRGRLDMHSEAELRYLEERKLKEKEAEQVRKQREAEIARQQGGSSGILGFLGLGSKPQPIQGHGLDEGELRRLQMQRHDAERDESSPKREKQESDNASDDEFVVKKKASKEQEEAPVKQRKGRALQVRKITKTQE